MIEYEFQPQLATGHILKDRGTRSRYKEYDKQEQLFDISEHIFLFILLAMTPRRLTT